MRELSKGEISFDKGLRNPSSIPFFIAFDGCKGKDAFLWGLPEPRVNRLLAEKGFESINY